MICMPAAYPVHVDGSSLSSSSPSSKRSRAHHTPALRKEASQPQPAALRILNSEEQPASGVILEHFSYAAIAGRVLDFSGTIFFFFFAAATECLFYILRDRRGSIPKFQTDSKTLIKKK
jgi:hypothetical protein